LLSDDVYLYERLETVCLDQESLSMVNDIKIVVKALNIKPMIFESHTILAGIIPTMVMP